MKDKSFQSLIDIVNAGGDTDTNAAMLGHLIGAWHGMKLFEGNEWALEGLQGYNEIVEVAEQFCEVFGIKD